MKNISFACLFFLVISGNLALAQNDENDREVPQKLKNPITVNYLHKNLRKQSPRLVLTDRLEKNLKQKLKTDPVIQNVYQAIKLNAEQVFEK